MIVTEETARRIADSLERLERLLKGIPVVPRVPDIDPGFGVAVCAYCGGHHGYGMMCPKLAPWVGP